MQGFAPEAVPADDRFRESHDLGDDLSWNDVPAALSRGEASRDEAASIQAHLEHCEPCRAAVAGLGAAADGGTTLRDEAGEAHALGAARAPVRAAEGDRTWQLDASAPDQQSTFADEPGEAGTFLPAGKPEPTCCDPTDVLAPSRPADGLPSNTPAPEAAVDPGPACPTLPEETPARPARTAGPTEPPLPAPRPGRRV